jgi:hypothetical protein
MINTGFATMASHKKLKVLESDEASGTPQRLMLQLHFLSPLPSAQC